jgi:hypothetical protein
MDIQDKRFAGKRLPAREFKFVGKLRPQQKKAVEELMRFDILLKVLKLHYEMFETSKT